MNTKMTYLYCNVDKDKAYEAVVIEGQLRYEDIEPYLQEGTYFIPEQVGLGALNGYYASVDHPYHELTEDDFEPTEAKPTVDLSALQLIANFEQAAIEGWDESYYTQTFRTG